MSALVARQLPAELEAATVARVAARSSARRTLRSAALLDDPARRQADDIGPDRRLAALIVT